MTDWSQRHLSLAKAFGEAVGEHRLETTSDLGQIDLGEKTRERSPTCSCPMRLRSVTAWWIGRCHTPP